MKWLVLLACVLVLPSLLHAWGTNKDRVRLEDITVLTLENGKMTNARRTSAIPQLKCVGGSSGCHGYKPKVVQCQNKGWDGYDVQWECKTDMDNSYRFGRIQVSCEGYDNPDDPYVLRGSCGLEYELDYTEEGHQRQREGAGGHDGGWFNQRSYGQPNYNNRSMSWGSLIMMVVIGSCLYWFCCSGRRSRRMQATPTPGASYSGTDAGTGTAGAGGGGGGWGNFFSGAATGGMLGYLFGNRGYRGGYGGYGGGGYGSSWGGGYTRGGGGGWGSGWGSGRSTGGSSYRSGSSSGSSGSRTTSGFGGTSRR